MWGNRGLGGVARSIKIVRSADAGETWLEPQVLAVNQGTVFYNAPMISMRDDRFVVTLNRQVVTHYQYFTTRSTDGGVTWDSIRQITFHPESHGWDGDLAATQDHVFLTYERATPPSYREIWFMMSSDSGTTWSDEQIISVIDDYDGWEPDIATDGKGNVYITWQDVKYGTLGFTGTVGHYLASSADPEQIPRSFGLFSAYPNPFNSETTVVFEIPERTPVHLSVFDLLGRELRTVFDGAVDAGVHRFTVDGAGLSTGIYYVELVTRGETRVLPVVLMR
jgi:hypothetical protein